MALRGRGFMSVGAAVACCALAAACTSEPAPSSTPSLSPAATTPTESQIERQIRLDYEAAETAYRGNIGRASSPLPSWRYHEGDPGAARHCNGLLLRNNPRVLAYGQEDGLACDRRDQDRRRGCEWWLEGEPSRLDQLRRQQRCAVHRSTRART